MTSPTASGPSNGSGSAAIIGTVAGVVRSIAVTLMSRLKRDEALDVWGVHGVGGTIGIIMLGLFASNAVNTAGANGLFAREGGGSFFKKELVAVAVVGVYCLLFTHLMRAVINTVTPVRITNEEQDAGVDFSLRGESAYEES
jgi:Amt family ammonium transporter